MSQCATIVGLRSNSKARDRKATTPAWVLLATASPGKATSTLRAVRKEVRLKRPGTLALLTYILCTVFASPAFAVDDVKPSTSREPANAATAQKDAKTPQADPPAAPRKYLEAGASLFNSGRFDLASKYFQAAQMYRDRLSASEQVVLDVYKEKLEHYLQTRTPSQSGATLESATSRTEVAKAPPSDSGVKPASVDVRPVTSRTVDPVQALSRRSDESGISNLRDPGNWPTLGPETSAPPGPTPAASATPLLGATATWRDTADSKQKARWLLQLAREQTLKGHFDVAQQAIDEARSIDIKWTVFDETPDRVADALTKARAKAGTNPTDQTGTHDRKAAKARLKEARAALAANDIERAEEIVREVRTWGVSYGLFDDTPEKVASSLFEARRREAVRNAELMVRSYYREGRPSTTGTPPGSQPAPSSDTETPRRPE